MSDDPDEIEALEDQVSTRHLVITVRDNAEMEADCAGFAPWEIAGLAWWLYVLAMQIQDEPPEEED